LSTEATRFAREEEVRRREAQERCRNQDQREAQQLAALEGDWSAFKAGVNQVQRANMQRAFFAYYDEVFNEVHAFFSPPPPAPEPGIIYIEQSDGSPRLGPDYNPKLAGYAALRWR